MEDNSVDRHAAHLAAILSQVLLEALVVREALSLADAVNVCVECRGLAKQVPEPDGEAVEQLFRFLETNFRKRLAESEGHRAH